MLVTLSIVNWSRVFEGVVLSLMYRLSCSSCTKGKFAETLGANPDVPQRRVPRDK